MGTHHGTAQGLVLALTSAMALAMTTGCYTVYFSDDIDLELDFSLRPSDELHLPYVVGARVQVSANSTDDHENRTGWVLKSSQPAVLLIESQANGQATCVALGAGTSEVCVYEPGESDPLDCTSIEVRVPDRLTLHAHGPMFLGHTEEETRIDQPKILTEGTATFLVRYFEGQTRLYGNSALDASATSAIDLNEETSFLFENQEWLQVTPREPGRHVVELRAGGHLVQTLQVVGVTAADVDRIELLGEDESNAEEGATLTVLGQAYDGNGFPIYGVEYAWDLDDVPEHGEGDLFRYTYKAHTDRQLSATFGDHRNEVTINASEGWVSSSNVVGCSAAAGSRPATPWGVLGLMAVAGIWVTTVRRRRSLGIKQ